MTCIVGYIEGDATIMAADSCASDGESVEQRIEPKAWYDGEWVVASMPSFRVMQILKHEMSIFETLGYPFDCDNRDIVLKLIPELKSKILEEPQPCTDFQILLGGAGNLWLIDADYAVNEVKDYVAIGSGAEYAIGSIHTNIRVGTHKGDQLAHEAVFTSCEFSNSCIPPIITRIS